MRARRRMAVAGALAVLAATAPTPAGGAPTGPAPRVVEATTTPTPTGELRSQTITLTDGRARAGAPAAGWTTEVDVAPGTQMVGVSWRGPADVEVEIRGRSGSGPWTDWAGLHADLPDAEGTGRLGAGPAWLGRAGVDTVAVRVVHGEPTDLQLEAMAHEGSAGTARAALDVAATPAGGPPIHTRAEWAPGGWQGWRSGCTAAPAVMDQLRFAVVHHTVSSNTYGPGDVPGLLAGMYRFHTQTNGWCDIAYTFFVDRFGGVWQGRSGSLHDPVMGGHAKGFNTDSVGVALLGQHQPGASPPATAPSGAAMVALRDLLAWKLSIHDVDPRATIAITSRGSPKYAAGRVVHLPTIQGHRDSGLTSCPGDLTYARLAQLRSDVAGRIASTAAPSRWAPASTGLRFFDRVRDDAAGRDVRSSAAARDASLVVRAGYPRDNVVHDLVFAPGTDARIGMVDRIYRAAFTRPPDAPGLAYWVSQRDRGRSVRWFAAAFSATPEFRARYDALGDAAYVEELYRNVLGRGADASGLQYWTRRLASGTTRAEVLTLFSESPEHIWITHAVTSVTRAWFSLLRRGPARADWTYWTQRFGAGDDNHDMVRAIVHSPEYARGA
ncbi:MAG TPA: DUF4214 domain-containing protein [Acidimicrobiales bacterium]|nr:DUF4214 domain-containing protein [Acidimicrobiales bacterium]